jgi:hypothetical protein
MLVFIIFLVWTALSLPVGMVVGRCLRRSALPPDAPRRARRLRRYHPPRSAAIIRVTRHGAQGRVSLLPRG